jgi:hypothetical protein
MGSAVARWTRIWAAARAAGDTAELRTFDGAHFGPITVGTKAWDTCADGLRQLTGG